MVKDEINSINKVIVLQMAIKAINNIAGYNSIILMLLVFRAFLRMIYLDPPILSITQQATIIRKAIAKVIKL